MSPVGAFLSLDTRCQNDTLPSGSLQLQSVQHAPHPKLEDRDGLINLEKSEWIQLYVIHDLADFPRTNYRNEKTTFRGFQVIKI